MKLYKTTSLLLFALSLATSLFAQKNRWISTDTNGQKIYLTIQSAENALFCQKVAEEIISSQ